jgi:hypothetical protein
VSRKYGRSSSRSVGRLQVGAVDRRALGQHRVGGLEGGDLVGERLVALGPPCASCRAGTRPSRGRPGPARSRRPGGARAGRTGRARRRRRRPAARDDGVDLADVGEELVAEALALAGAPRPGRRCRRTAPRRAPRCGSSHLGQRSSRSSGTLATPTLGSVVAKAYGAARAPPPAEGVVQRGLARRWAEPTNPKRSILAGQGPLRDGPHLDRPVALRVDDAGAHPAGAQHAHADRETGVADRVVQVLADGHDRVLRGVVARAEARHEPGDGGRVHDVPPAHQVREEGPAAVHHAPEVHAHHPLPRRQRAEPGVGAGGHPGVVADHVHGAEAVERALHELGHLRLLAHVAPDRQRLHAVGLHPVGRQGEGVLLHVGHHDVQPALGEPLGQCEPDAAPGPGDHGHLSLGELHVDLPLVPPRGTPCRRRLRP